MFTDGKMVIELGRIAEIVAATGDNMNLIGHRGSACLSAALSTQTAYLVVTRALVQI